MVIFTILLGILSLLIKREYASMVMMKAHYNPISTTKNHEILIIGQVSMMLRSKIMLNHMDQNAPFCTAFLE